MIEALQIALTHMETALDVLDSIDAPGEIGAHLDTALCRLRDVIEQTERQSGTVEVTISAK